MANRLLVICLLTSSALLSARLDAGMIRLSFCPQTPAELGAATATDCSGWTHGPFIVPVATKDLKRLSMDELEAKYRGRADVWDPFIESFKRCAPGCVPYDVQIFNTAPWAMCHRVGRAVDVAGLFCGSQLFEAIHSPETGDHPFARLVACMRADGFDGPKTLWHWPKGDRNPITGHRTHAHFSIGCPAPGGGIQY